MTTGSEATGRLPDGRDVGPWLVVLISILYLGFTSAMAAVRPLTYDDLFTLYLARLSPMELWAALRAGADPLPPLGYLFAGASVHAFGEYPLTVRLPDVLGFWLMGLGVYGFVARRTSPAGGALAMLFPLVAPAHWFAYLAKPYGLVVGFAALALVAWRAAAEGRRRRLALVGLGVSLGAAFSSHYYGALVVYPLALGEAVRSCARRRLDRPVWIALAAGLAPLAVLWPLMRGAVSYAPHWWTTGGWKAIPGTYRIQIRPVLLVVVTLMAVVAWLRWRRASRMGTAESSPHGALPAHEWAAVLGLLTLPMLAVLLAQLLGIGFVTRYALSVLIGVSIVFGWSAHRLTAARPWLAALLGLLLVAWIVGSGLVEGRQSLRQAATRRHTYALLEAHATPSLPIVVTKPMVFLPLVYGAPADLAPRLHYLADRTAAIRAVRTDTLDVALERLGPLARIPVETYAAFLSTHPEFFVWDPPGVFGWVRSALEADGVELEVRLESEVGTLMLARSHHAVAHRP